MTKNNVLNAILILAVSLTVSLTAIAGNPEGNALVKGVIKDNNNNQPLAYSSIALFDKNNNLVSYGTLSDTKGKFYLKNVPYGNYDLVVYQIGYYKKYIFNIQLSGNHNYVNVGKLKLSENDKQNYYVEIIGKKTSKDNYFGYKDLQKNILINNADNL